MGDKFYVILSGVC